MKPKIVVVGSSNTDMICRVPHIPRPGETILGSDFLTVQGGKGANQAVAASRAGADVIFISCVGDDAFGQQSIESYRKDGIDTTHIKVQAGTHSGIALINVADDGENSIAVAPGANSHLLPGDIGDLMEVFKGAKIILVQLEVPLATVETVASVARSLGIPMILNPAPAASLSREILGSAAILTPNETEAALLTSRKTYTDNDIPLMARELFDMGIPVVLLTMGSKGVYLKSAGFDGNVPGFKVQAVDTTAAGDVFNGALAAALAGEMPLPEAIAFAQKASAISVTRMGAQPSAPYLNEILKFNE